MGRRKKEANVIDNKVKVTKNKSKPKRHSELECSVKYIGSIPTLQFKMSGKTKCYDAFGATVFSESGLIFIRAADVNDDQADLIAEFGNLNISQLQQISIVVNDLIESMQAN